jgi:hypothetical protein
MGSDAILECKFFCKVTINENAAENANRGKREWKPRKTLKTRTRGRRKKEGGGNGQVVEFLERQVWLKRDKAKGTAKNEEYLKTGNHEKRERHEQGRRKKEGGERGQGSVGISEAEGLAENGQGKRNGEK